MCRAQTPALCAFGFVVCSLKRSVCRGQRSLFYLKTFVQSLGVGAHIVNFWQKSTLFSTCIRELLSMAVPFSVCTLTRAQLGRWLCSRPLPLSPHVCQQEQGPRISSHPIGLPPFLQGKNQLPPFSRKLVSPFCVWQNTKSQRRAGTKAASRSSSPSCHVLALPPRNPFLIKGSINPAVLPLSVPRLHRPQCPNPSVCSQDRLPALQFRKRTKCGCAQGHVSTSLWFCTNLKKI